MQILANTNFNFIRWRWHAIALSVAIIAAGVYRISTHGLPLGVDFTGGTVLQLQFAQPVSEDVIRKAIPGEEETVQQLGPASERTFLVRLPLSSTATENVEKDVQVVLDALTKANIGAYTPLKTEAVGPTIGKDLQRKGIFATVFSLVGIMLYIAFRFRFSFGIGAMVASLHDVLVTLSLLTFFGYEISLNVVAAILTLTGYGVNDQIVVFDRVRENLRVNRREPMDTVINLSVNQTLPRTIITAGVTALAVLALFLFGGDVLEGFAFTLLAGIITSTYSTVYIASAVAVVLSPRRPSGPAATAAGARARRATT